MPTVSVVEKPTSSSIAKPVIPAPSSTPAPESARILAAKAAFAGRQTDNVETLAPSVAEAPKEASEAPQEETEQLSPKFAALARKERALRSKIQEIKAKEEALKAKESEYTQLSTLKGRLTQDPLAVLNELGITYDQLTNYVLNQPNPETQAYAKLQSEIEAVKAAQSESQKKYQEQQQQQYEQAVGQIRRDIQQLVAVDPTYETVKAMGAEEKVVDYIKEYFNQTGEVLDLSVATGHVEEYLVDEAMKIAQLNKIKQKLMPAAPAPAQTKQQPLQKQHARTLTSQATVTSPGKLTDRERRDRAILAFRGQLK